MRSICRSVWPPEHWESHTDLPEIRALQGRRPEDEGTGGGTDDELSEDQEEDRQDQEDRGHPTEAEEKPAGFTANMYSTLRESQCE